MDGRSKNLNQFKPGARSIMLIFSDQDGSGVYRFPWYDRFKQWVEPWLEKVRAGSLLRSAALVEVKKAGRQACACMHVAANSPVAPPRPCLAPACSCLARRMSAKSCGSSLR